MEFATKHEFECSPSDLPGHPDLAFRKQQIAVMFHGCFWHSHDCPAARRPSSNWTAWYTTLETTAARDRKNRERLLRLGWASLVIWECAFKADPNAAISQVTDALDRSRYG